MREDTLSPVVGRLIDAAKGEFFSCGGGGMGAVAVAFLMEDGSTVARISRADQEGRCRAAEEALGTLGGVPASGIDAVALAGDPSLDSMYLCTHCREVLGSIDEDMPVVVKQAGRWVMVPLCDACEPL